MAFQLWSLKSCFVNFREDGGYIPKLLSLHGYSCQRCHILVASILIICSGNYIIVRSVIKEISDDALVKPSQSNIFYIVCPSLKMFCLMAVFLFLYGIAYLD